MLLILVIPAGLTYTYGRMVGSQRQGWAIFAAMFVLFVAGVIVVYIAEQHGTAAQHAAGLHTAAFDGSTGGNMEGKEQRFGIADSSLWTAMTTVTSCGAVNAAFESLTGLGGAVPFVQPRLQRGRLRRRRRRPLLDAPLRPPRRLHRRPDGRPHPRVPGQEDPGAGDQAGLARRPGHAADGAALRRDRLGGRPARRSIYAGVNPQGFSETLYAYLSQANNNGSAFAGYTGFVQPHAPGNAGAYGITFADLLGGAVMVGARFLPILFVLAVAGALAGKKVSPAGLGTMRTDNPTFVFLLIGVVILVGALTFFPAILLGPIVQSLTTRLF